MKALWAALSRHFEDVPDLVRRNRWLVWSLVIGLTVLAVMGMGHARFDTTIEGWFADDDPTILGMDEFRARFGSDDSLYIIYKPKDGDVFSAESLATARAIRRDLLDRRLSAPADSPLKHIVKITDLSSAPVLRVQEDALVSRHLVGSRIPSSPQELDEIRHTAGLEKSFPLQYFSKDYRYGGILIETNFGSIPVGETASVAEPADSSAQRAVDLSFDADVAEQRTQFQATAMQEYIDFAKAVQVTLDKPEFASRFDYYPVGNPVTMEYNAQVLGEMGLLYLSMLVIMIVVLWCVFRSLSGVLWPTVIVILSVIWSIGYASWLDMPFTAFLILSIIMTLVIGIADSVHILSGYEYFRNQGEDHRTALRSVYRSAAGGCFMTTITSMAGVMSVAISPIIPIKVWGLMTAAGIGFAFLFTLYVLPLMIDLWWAKRRDTARRGIGAAIGKLFPDVATLVQALIKKLFPVVERYRYFVAGIFVATLVTCLFGALKVQVNTDVKDQFPKDAQIRQNIDIADQKMMGSQTLEVYFDLHEEYAFQDPRALKRLDELQQQIETSYSHYVVRTLSLIDVAKESYRVLHEGRQEMYAIPETRAELSQTLFLFDSSNPVERRRMVADDYSKAHISVYLRNGGSKEYQQVFADIQKDMNRAVESLRPFYPQAEASVTGMFVLSMQATDYISWTSISEFGSAIVIISAILLVMFGTLKAGMISILSNAVPATLSFGLMGWLGAPLDFTTVLVAPIVLAIAVDDTIHFLVHYKHEVAVDGDIRRALQQTLQEVGQSVTFTAMILGFGFSVLGLSSSPGNANVGIYGSVAVLAGLMCDLLLLPALILIFKLRFKQHTAAEGAHGSLAAPASAG